MNVLLTLCESRFGLAINIWAPPLYAPRACVSNLRHLCSTDNIRISEGSPGLTVPDFCPHPTRRFLAGGDASIRAHHAEFGSTPDSSPITASYGVAPAAGRPSSTVRAQNAMLVCVHFILCGKGGVLFARLVRCGSTQLKQGQGWSEQARAHQVVLSRL